MDNGRLPAILEISISPLVGHSSDEPIIDSPDATPDAPASFARMSIRPNLMFTFSMELILEVL
jgi:hypothetical protein